MSASPSDTAEYAQVQAQYYWTFSEWESNHFRKAVNFQFLVKNEFDTKHLWSQDQVLRIECYKTHKYWWLVALNGMKRWIKDFLLDYFKLQKLRRVGQKIKLNRVQKLFQSMMSIVSGIQSGKETSIYVLLRTPHFKEILSRHSNMNYKCSNALPSWCQNIILYPRIWKNLRQTTFVAGNQKMRTQ